MNADVIENKDGLYDLLGIPETHILCAKPGDIVILHVDASNTEEQMNAYGLRVRAVLPDNPVIVLPKNVYISTFPKEMGNGVYVTRVSEATE